MSNIYLGYDIHAYTKIIKPMLGKYISYIDNKYGNILSDAKNWEKLICELKNKYGNKVAIFNIQKNYKHGKIVDPDLPGLNIAILLLALWDIIKKINDISIYRHFGETLDCISNTCIQGISHRLFYDYVIFCNDNL